MHRQRCDVGFVESAWMSSKVDLPQPPYTWEAQDLSAHAPKPIATNRFRKVLLMEQIYETQGRSGAC